MTTLQSVVLTLPARLDDRAMAVFEGVFSELLDSAATSFQRDNAGDWQIEALFTSTPDAAIIDLARSGQLRGASLLVNGPSAADAVKAWRDLADPPPLTLHLCLTEGHGLPNCPDLPTGFGSLLLASLLPWQRRRIAPQLRTVLQQLVTAVLTGVAPHGRSHYVCALTAGRQQLRPRSTHHRKHRGLLPRELAAP